LVFAVYFFYPKSPEAKKWLASNENKYALAGNRFASTEDAIIFVDRLYELGAIRVVIPKDSIFSDEKRIREEGGPYADALEITLPKTEPERGMLLDVAKKEADDQGMAFSPESDITRNKLLLWWD
jgi:hypothetical protein